MSVSLFNKGIAGWRVQANETLRFHTAEPSGPEGFRHFQVPEGTLGTPTGEVIIYYAGANEEACKTLAVDNTRLKKLLEHPELFAPVRNASNYWEAAKKLKGDEGLAASLALNVVWDNIPKNQTENGKFLSYLPWLKLASGK
jgi:hypothetical protein